MVSESLELIIVNRFLQLFCFVFKVTFQREYYKFFISFEYEEEEQFSFRYKSFYGDYIPVRARKGSCYGSETFFFQFLIRI